MNSTTVKNLSHKELTETAKIRPEQFRRASFQVEAEKELLVRISKAIEENPAAVVKALEILYNNQTSEEQANGTVVSKNDRGFKVTDAKLGTWLVTVVIQKGREQGRPEKNLLRGRALEMGKEIARKYVRTQLLDSAYQKA